MCQLAIGQMAKEDSKQVEIVGADDKHQTAAVLCMTKS